MRGQQTALINELIEGQKVVQAFSHETQSLEDFDTDQRPAGSGQPESHLLLQPYQPQHRMVNNIVYAAVGLISALYTVSGGITVGTAELSFSYASQYRETRFNEISGVVTELQNALACAARIFDLMDEQDQIPRRSTPWLSPAMAMWR